MFYAEASTAYSPAPQPSDAAAPTPSPSRDSSDGAAALRAAVLGIVISGALALFW